MRFVLCLLSVLALSGCSYFHPYRPDIEQGNVMAQKYVSQIKPGMSKAEVTRIMGTPVLSQTIPSNQEDYVYTYAPNSGAYQYWRVTVTFRNGVVTNVSQLQYAGDVRHSV